MPPDDGWMFGKCFALSILRKPKKFCVIDFEKELPYFAAALSLSGSVSALTKSLSRASSSQN